VVIEKDDQGKPDVGKAALAAAYADDKVDIAVGPTASPVALATASPRNTVTGEACRSAIAPKISGEMNAATAVVAKA